MFSYEYAGRRRTYMPNFCSVSGCNKPCHGLGYCDTHYRRFKRNGHPGLQPKREKAMCSAPGCDNVAHSKGLCEKHLWRMKRGGCLEPRYRDKSGIARTHPREYRAWAKMKSRCYDKNDNSYHDYGRRGITVCKRWLEKPYGFRNFLSDMGGKPGPEYSIDRIDNNGPYSPENCRWATAKEQANNRRARKDLRLYTHNGVTKSLREWSEATGIPLNKLRTRYYSKTFDRSNLFQNRDLRRKI